MGAQLPAKSAAIIDVKLALAAMPVVTSTSSASKNRNPRH